MDKKCSLMGVSGDCPVVGLLFARILAADEYVVCRANMGRPQGTEAGPEKHMDQSEYQGLGPDERVALSQLFREMEREERGAPEVEMHDRSGLDSMNPADLHNIKKTGFSASAIVFEGVTNKKATKTRIPPL